MYQTLWNSINKQVKNSHASAAFLAVSLMGWTTIGLLAGFLICMIGDMSFVIKITVVSQPEFLGQPVYVEALGLQRVADIITSVPEGEHKRIEYDALVYICLLYTSPSPRDRG